MGDKSSYVVYLMLGLGHNFKGVFATGDDGLQYFESDTGIPPFRPEIEFARALASAVQKHLQLDDQVEIKTRDVEANAREARRIIILGGPPLTDEQAERLRRLAVTVAEQVCPGAQLMLLDPERPIVRDEECVKVAVECTHAFLHKNGGRRVPHLIQLVADEQPIAEIQHLWRSPPPVERHATIEDEVVLYDGRQLRAHVLYVTKTDSRGTTLPISYDEQQFDALFKSLGDNKLAALEIQYEAEYVNGKTKPLCRLLSAIPVDLPSKFQQG